MGRSLKDQLEQLGLKKQKSEVPIRPARLPQNNSRSAVPHSQQQGSERPKKSPPARPPENKVPLVETKKEMAHRQVNFCDSCSKTLPDVEFYEHTNRILMAKWLCVRCADENKVLDNCRKTAQSDFSKRKLFRREYGPTMRYVSNQQK